MNIHKLGEKSSGRIAKQCSFLMRFRGRRGNFNLLAHTEKSFQNLIKSNRNHIVFTIIRFIWNQTYARLVINQSENGKYNLISC